MSREALLSRTFVELADTLVDEFDVVELLTLLSNRCVEILDVAEAGIMLATTGGELRVMGSSSDAMHVLEVFEEQNDEGPCPDCYRTGRPILNHSLADASLWPSFTPKALSAGFRSVHALPMHLRGVTIGALNMFGADGGVLNEDAAVTAQALADIATIAILQNRAAQQAQQLNEQLAQALNTRVVIEQAKGIISERAGVGMEVAFQRLRRHARNRGALLADIATAIVNRSLRTEDLND